ncbi:MAG: cation:proton antiporter [Candidatus Diapherotrites archaeon]|nr:cation:proton antiporter [Candidatus Diapherotrites archaeon]
MIDTLTILLIASVILFIGFIGEIIFKRTNIPDIIWLIIFGIILGLFMNPAQKEIAINLAGPFGAIALMLILFKSGLNMRISKFVKGVPRGLVLSVASFIFSILTTLIFTSLLKWPLSYGLLLGITVGGTSSSVIAPIITKLKVSDVVKPMLIIESSATDILVVVLGIALIDIIGKGLVDVYSAVQSVIAAFAIGITMGSLFGIIWFFVLVRIEKEIKSYIVTLAALMFAYVFIEFIGGNGALGALMFGLVLGNKNELRKLIKLPEEATVDKGAKFFYSEIEFFIKTFFFVYLGMLINFARWDLVAYGLILAIAFMIMRYFAAELALFNETLKRYDKRIISVMAGRGLAAAVIAQMPLYMLPSTIPHYEILKGFTTLVLSVILFTIIFTVIGVSLIKPDNEKEKKNKNQRTGK